MSYGWILTKGEKKRPRQRNRRKTCRVCGNVATIGSYCDTCREFLLKEKERQAKKNNGLCEQAKT